MCVTVLFNALVEQRVLDSGNESMICTRSAERAAAYQAHSINLRYDAVEVPACLPGRRIAYDTAGGGNDRLVRGLCTNTSMHCL